MSSEEKRKWAYRFNKMREKLEREIPALSGKLKGKPQGHARAKDGELDLFLYRTGECYENIATGESKEWAPEKFNGQLKQLLGYLREEGGFGGVKLYPVLFLQKLKQEYVTLCRINYMQCYTGNETISILPKRGSIKL